MMEEFVIPIAQAGLVFLVTYVFLTLFLRDKQGKEIVGKDVKLGISFFVSILAFSYPAVGIFLKSFVAFVALIIVFIFITAMIFGVSSGTSVFEVLRKEKIFIISVIIVLVAAAIYLGATAYWSSLSSPSQTSNQTSGISNYFNRTPSPVERVVFDPRLLSAIFFLGVFAAIMYITGKAG